MKCKIEQKDRIYSYKHICDHVYDGSSIPSGGIFSIWCKRDNTLFDLFNKIRNNPDTRYIIITHASDFGIDKKVVDNLPDNVIKLFGQNILHRDNRVESIPIGSMGCSWIGDEEYACTHFDNGAIIEDFQLIEESGEEKSFRNLALMDFAIRSNPSHRKPIYDFFKDKEWVTTNPCEIYSLEEYKKTAANADMSNYFNDVYNHKFIISPLGNGVDCGRYWQAIYLGSIPIIPRHLNIEYYSELPILVYDDINDITEDYLNKKWDEMKDKEYNLDKARLSYWKEQINKAKNEK